MYSNVFYVNYCVSTHVLTFVANVNDRLGTETKSKFFHLLVENSGFSLLQARSLLSCRSAAKYVFLFNAFLFNFGKNL